MLLLPRRNASEFSINIRPEIVAVMRQRLETFSRRIVAFVSQQRLAVIFMKNHDDLLSSEHRRHFNDVSVFPSQSAGGEIFEDFIEKFIKTFE